MYIKQQMLLPTNFLTSFLVKCLWNSDGQDYLKAAVLQFQLSNMDHRR